MLFISKDTSNKIKTGFESFVAFALQSYFLLHLYRTQCDIGCRDKIILIGNSLAPEKRGLKKSLGQI